MPTQTGKYSTTKTYQALIVPKPTLNISKLTWVSIVIPKQRFMTWLAVKGRLLIQEKKVDTADSSGEYCMLFM